ncbi:NIF family HAD-type phosphatase [Vibrio sp. 10N.222.51.C8]|uniref:NIF family HAD-type phosphatase n=1 Tax=Vibrio sp. 10N.222.51.C8 TaxID=3229624 RepID=UPI003552E6B1
MIRNKIKVIALDLEGTLISNAISQIPRPHLHTFLDGCLQITERVVMLTTVNEHRFREIAELLVSEGSAPAWFSSMEYIHWSGHKKDLSFVPNAETEAIILVDDVEAYVAEGQDSQWIEIEQFASPYPDSDDKLLEVLEILRSGDIKGLATNDK